MLAAVLVDSSSYQYWVAILQVALKKKRPNISGRNGDCGMLKAWERQWSAMTGVEEVRNAGCCWRKNKRNCRACRSHTRSDKK
jgi:hypothetical protein